MANLEDLAEVSCFLRASTKRNPLSEKKTDVETREEIRRYSRRSLTFAENESIMGNMKNLLFKKWWIITVIALLTGLFMVSEETMDCLDLYRRLGIELGKESILLLMFECLFFMIYSWLLLVVNTVWRPNRLAHVKHLAVTALCAFIFLTIANLFILPWVESVNHLAHDQIRELFLKGLDRRERHIPRYLHVPIEAWYNGIVTLAVIIYTLSRIYLLNITRKEYERKMELLRGESLQSRLDALSNQINPHFFFNSLNSLYGLIAEDQKEKSLRYLDNLSQVFRYILQSERKGLVSLREELDFLDKYRYMLRVKYDEKLRFEIHVDETALVEQLPVLSLLPLIENVTKHNAISARKPMTITITTEKDTDSSSILIVNPKQPRLDEIERSGIGLKNLDNRFRLLLGKGIMIGNEENLFWVRLPLKATTNQEIRL